MKAIAARQPFLLAYQGGNDRALQEIYGDIVSRIVAQHFAPAPLPPPPAPGEPIRVGIVSAFFFRHSNWKIPIKGWLSQLDRSRFRVTGYHLGIIRDEPPPRPPRSATASCIARSTPKAGGGKSSPTPRMC